MSAQHTPGPWVAELETEGAFSIEADGMGIGRGLLVIASRNQHPFFPEQMHANALLLAAAPDLLAALQEAKANAGNPEAVYRITSAAIAKATGDEA